MPVKGHQQTSDRIEFCRVPKCKQTDYRAVSGKVTWKSEAHHILCVAQVNKVVSGVKKEVKKVIDESKWCINANVNMIALPIWGTTVLYYCDDFSSIKKNAVKVLKQEFNTGDLRESETKRPPFENLPQHNYGHSGKTVATSYNKEVEAKLRAWLAKVKVKVAAHKINGDGVQRDLNRMSRELRRTLRNRGKRKGCTKGQVGTHDAWKNPSATWYKPFSMAQTPTKLPSPKLVEKVVKIAKALWRS